MKIKKGLVEFKNVSFRYPDADEDLTDINFTANLEKQQLLLEVQEVENLQC